MVREVKGRGRVLLRSGLKSASAPGKRRLVADAQVDRRESARAARLEELTTRVAAVLKKRQGTQHFRQRERAAAAFARFMHEVGGIPLGQRIERGLMMDLVLAYALWKVEDSDVMARTLEHEIRGLPFDDWLVLHDIGWRPSQDLRYKHLLFQLKVDNDVPVKKVLPAAVTEAVRLIKVWGEDAEDTSSWTTQHLRDGGLIFMMFLTARRAADVARLRWAALSIDEDDKSISIDFAMSGTKNNLTRAFADSAAMFQLAGGAPVVDMLCEYRNRIQQELGVRATGPLEPLWRCLDLDGVVQQQPLSVQRVRSIVRQAGSLIGVHWSSRSMRAGAATAAIAAGVPGQVVRAQANWRDKKSVPIYLRFTKDMQRRMNVVLQQQRAWQQAL